MALRVRQLESLEEIAGLEPAWERLARANATRTVFLSYAWLTTWWRHFGEAGRPQFLLFERQGELVGAAPLLADRARLLGRPADRVRFAANGESQRCDFLALPEERDAVAAALADRLLRDDMPWDVLELGPTPEESENLAALRRELSARRIPLGHVRSLASPYLPVRSGWEAALAALPHGLRHTIAQCTRRLERQGRSAFILAGQADGDELVDRMFWVAESSWQGEAGRSLASRAAVRAFYRDLWRAAGERGWQAGGVLMIDDEPAAFCYCLDYGDTVSFLKTGYRRQHYRYAPGVLLLARLLQRAFELGRQECDLLGDADPYKLRWTQHLRQHIRLVAYGRSARARAAYVGRFIVRPRLARIPALRRIKRMLVRRPGRARARTG